MVNVIVELSKYIMIILVAVYTYSCFSVFAEHDLYQKKHILVRQNWLMFTIQFIAYMVMYLQMKEFQLILFYLAQVVLLAGTILLYVNIYPKASRLVINNMCMLICIGFIMITRLDYDKAVKQFVVVLISITISFLVPVLIRKLKFLSKWTNIYAAVGVIALLAVAVIGETSYGAKLGFSIGGISIQPSEFVKILFVFYVASSLRQSTEFKNVVKTTVIAALHVLILVASTDLGAAVIMFVVYLVMLYVATHQPLYALAGLGAGSVAAVIAYQLFDHVKTRVIAWKDPFSVYDTGRYQVAQSLFAIGTGGWFGMGLFKGSPDTIPVVVSDFVFSAISEEMGALFSICLILVYFSCFIMFINISLQLVKPFYKLVAIGLSTAYGIQLFLCIGGVIKLIPHTGVTMPLISYGGSSVLSTIIIFAVIQGLYLLRQREVHILEKRRDERDNEEEYS